MKTTLANMAGYAMGMGSMVVYTPMLAKALRQRDLEGMAVGTWVCYALSCALSVAYPMRMGFPVSTYVDLVLIGLQAVLMLALLCAQRGALMPFGASAAALSAAFAAFVWSPSVPAHLLRAVQVTALLLSSAAHLPQIAVTFRSKKACWSQGTALLCMLGCMVRIWTTLQLTNDRLQLLGHALGLLSNTVLLGQGIAFRSSSSRP